MKWIDIFIGFQLGFLTNAVIVRLDHPDIANDIIFPFVILCLTVITLGVRYFKSKNKFITD